MTYRFVTYGCQMNVRDSEAVAAIWRARGWTPAASEDEADVVVINTCSVRGKAEAKALGKLGLLSTGSRGTRPQVVAAMGCMVERMGAALFDKVPRLDLAVGTHALARLPDAVECVLAGGRRVLDIGPADDREALAGHVADGPCAFVNILLGCDRRCAYCIVPAVRGPEWSRPGEAIVAEVRRLVDRGVREVTLLGQSVMSYGRRQTVWPAGSVSARGYGEPFPRLLDALGAMPDLARLRFTSGHPSGCTAELARAMAETPAVCGYLHLPLQSGSDAVLRRMRRGYDADGYRDAVALLRGRVPDLAIGTDIIVGFPGETEADFERTRAMMDEIGFNHAYIFKYSPRPGTPAHEWSDDVPVVEKARRNQVLLADQNRRSLAANRRKIGQSVRVLVEGPSPRNARRWTGRTRTNTPAFFPPAPGVAPGAEIDIDIAWTTAQALYAREDTTS